MNWKVTDLFLTKTSFGRGLIRVWCTISTASLKIGDSFVTTSFLKEFGTTACIFEFSGHYYINDSAEVKHMSSTKIEKTVISFLYLKCKAKFSYETCHIRKLINSFDKLFKNQSKNSAKRIIHMVHTQM